MYKHLDTTTHESREAERQAFYAGAPGTGRRVAAQPTAIPAPLLAASHTSGYRGERPAAAPILPIAGAL